MNIFSLFRSSAADILLGRRPFTVIYAILGLAVMADMLSSAQQIWHAYATLHQFDTPAAAVNAITVCLFLPLWAVGALMLRACLQRLRLSIWVRHAITTAQYDTALQPAEAGFLADYIYSRRELAAALVELHMRGVVRLMLDPLSDSVTIVPLNADGVVLSAYEDSLLASLQNARQSQFHGFADLRLIEIAQPAHAILISDLASRHMLQPERLPSKAVRKIFKVIYWIAGIVGLLNAYNFTFHYNKVTSIGYPRYPLYASEVLVVLGIAVLAAAVIITGFWPRYVRDYKDPQYEAWIDAAGLLLYIRTVFETRFAANAIGEQDEATLRHYGPYAVAYGIIPAHVKRISQLLALVSPAV